MNAPIRELEQQALDVERQIQLTRRDAVPLKTQPGKTKPAFRNLKMCEDDIQRTAWMLKSQENAWHRQRHQEFLNSLGSQARSRPDVPANTSENPSGGLLSLNHDARKHDPAWEALQRAQNQLSGTTIDLGTIHKEREERRHQKAQSGQDNRPAPNRPLNQPVARQPWSLMGWRPCGCFS